MEHSSHLTCISNVPTRVGAAAAVSGSCRVDCAGGPARPALIGGAATRVGADWRSGDTTPEALGPRARLTGGAAGQSLRVCL